LLCKLLQVQVSEANVYRLSSVVTCTIPQ
jgi:hypothetical protein